MFKRIDTAWKSRTPTYLHNGTKENLIWQLKLTAVLVAGMWAYGWYEDRQEQKKYKNLKSN